MFGYDFRLHKTFAGDKEPVLSMHASGGVYWMTGYMPDTTVELMLKTPLGAPLLTGCETFLHHGRTVYRMPRAWQHECRIFVTGADGLKFSCREKAPVSYRQRHRLIVTGLVDAVVYVLSDTLYGDYTELLLNSKAPYLVGEDFIYERVDTIYGPAICAKHITGTLIVSDCVGGGENSYAKVEGVSRELITRAGVR